MLTQNSPREMNKFFLKIVIFYLIQTCRSEDWCALNCPDEVHIACKYEGQCNTNASCQTVAIDPEKILDVHNKIRNDFATGKAPNAKNIVAANMLALVWDDKLAFLARCNLKECSGSLNHDRCHTTKDFSSAGQNLGMSMGWTSCSDMYRDVAKKWYDEIEQMSEDQIKDAARSYKSNHDTGHFTQLVWAKTTHVGCAVTGTTVGSTNLCLLSCNYGPAGNVLGTSMFEEGAPASHCPPDIRPNSKYEGLCGRGYALKMPMIVLFLCLLFGFVL